MTSKTLTSHEYIELLQSYEGAMYRIAKGILIEEEDCKDALQEIMIRAYKNREKVKDMTYFKTWVLRITINECNRIYKKRKAWTPLCWINNHSIKDKDIEEYIDLHSAVSELAKRHREPLILYYFGGCSYEEIANILELPVGTVKSRMYYAKNILKERLGGTYE